jgi:hypothetical protein
MPKYFIKIVVWSCLQTSINVGLVVDDITRLAGKLASFLITVPPVVVNVTALSPAPDVRSSKVILLTPPWVAVSSPFAGSPARLVKFKFNAEDAASIK